MCLIDVACTHLEIKDAAIPFYLCIWWPSIVTYGHGFSILIYKYDGTNSHGNEIVFLSIKLEKKKLTIRISYSFAIEHDYLLNKKCLINCNNSNS